MSDKRHHLSILDQWATESGQVSRSHERLTEIDGFIDWEPLYEVGRRIDKIGPQGGQPRKPVRWMIRGLFLQHLYQRSDPQLAGQLTRRLSFRRFAGLPLDQPVPGFMTFWRFREALAAEGLIGELFARITSQLEGKGLILKRGTVVDATIIIESSGRPLGEDQRTELETNPSPQIDTDADSTQKGGAYYFGYKGHIGMDVPGKLIHSLSFTGASPHDSTQLENLLSGDERAIFGDKAYPSKDLKIRCRQKGIYYGILVKPIGTGRLAGPKKTVTPASAGYGATSSIPSRRSKIATGCVGRKQKPSYATRPGLHWLRSAGTSSAGLAGPKPDPIPSRLEPSDG